MTVAAGWLDGLCRALMESDRLGAAVLRHDQPHRLVLLLANPAYAQLAGRSLEALMASPNLTHLQSGGLHGLEEARLKAKGQAYGGVFAWRLPQGRGERMVRTLRVPFAGPQGGLEFSLDRPLSHWERRAYFDTD